MKQYKVREIVGGKFGVFMVTASGETRVKVFKTRKSAENWISKH